VQCQLCPPPATQIEDKAAFRNRDSILGSLTLHLLNATVQIPAGTVPAVLLSSCGVEGCLQLLFTASSLEGRPPFAIDDDPSAFFAALHAQLPASYRRERVSIHLGGWLACFEGNNGAGGGGGGGGAQQLLQQPTLRRVLGTPDTGDGSLQWAPVCFESSTPDVAEVVLDSWHPGAEPESGVQHLLACLGGAGGGAHDAMEGVEAVVKCTIQGQAVSGKLPLQGVLGSPGSGRWVMVRAVPLWWYSVVYGVSVARWWLSSTWVSAVSRRIDICTAFTLYSSHMHSSFPLLDCSAACKAYCSCLCCKWIHRCCR
jgi:hypothetical protein